MKRDLSNAMIAGVCSGISNSTKIDKQILRIIFALATLFGVGFPVIIYIILAIVLPVE